MDLNKNKKEVEIPEEELLWCSANTCWTPVSFSAPLTLWTQMPPVQVGGGPLTYLRVKWKVPGILLLRWHGGSMLIRTRPPSRATAAARRSHRRREESREEEEDEEEELLWDPTVGAMEEHLERKWKQTLTTNPKNTNLHFQLLIVHHFTFIGLHILDVLKFFIISEEWKDHKQTDGQTPHKPNSGPRHKSASLCRFR